MARRMMETPLDLNKPLKVRREFRLAGRPFYVGQDFDWKQYSIDARKVRQLYDTRKIIHTDSVTYPEPPKVKTPVYSTTETDTAANSASDELDAIDDMNELRDIAEREGAPRKVSKSDQRQAIRDNRSEPAE